MSAHETPRALLHRLARQARTMLQAERDAGIVDIHGTPAPRVAPPPQRRPTDAQPRSPQKQTTAQRRSPPKLARSARPATIDSGSTVSSKTANEDRPTRRAPPAGRPTFKPRVPALDLPDDILTPFADLSSRVAACTACRLCEDRTFTVFGEGSPTARLVFCGEGPGFEEDKSGRPFVGRAGELLTRMIVGGLKMRREDVFILNAVKCRPPGNRNPKPDEVASCKPFLEEQLRVIAPDVIVTLGNPGTHAILGEIGGITRVRGQVHEAYGAKVVPTFHPAYLLRHQPAKREAWQDLQLVMQLLAESGGDGE